MTNLMFFCHFMAHYLETSFHIFFIHWGPRPLSAPLSGYASASLVSTTPPHLLDKYSHGYLDWYPERHA